jgi:hypothetical protein
MIVIVNSMPHIPVRPIRSDPFCIAAVGAAGFHAQSNLGGCPSSWSHRDLQGRDPDCSTRIHVIVMCQREQSVLKAIDGIMAMQIDPVNLLPLASALKRRRSGAGSCRAIAPLLPQLIVYCLENRRAHGTGPTVNLTRQRLADPNGASGAVNCSIQHDCSRKMIPWALNV